MESFEKKLEVRWSDLDPNFHMLHSKYYDVGAYCRMSFLVDQGLTPQLMKDHHFGLILFREECIFKREINFGDALKINLLLSKRTADYGRWSMYHEIWKNDYTLAAVIHVDGAWIDTAKRKLTKPPVFIQTVFDNAPLSKEFIIS